MKFECHITCPRAQADDVKMVAENSIRDWKFSAIDGDPVLGPGARCYLTRYSTDYVDALDGIKAISKVLGEHGVLVMRQKIELIMFDSLHGGPQ